LSPSERLFWRDAYQSDFTAQVVRRLSVDGRPAVVLDETCFYPTSGGQPHDTGTLNQVPVVDVVELDGAIVHVLVEPLEAEAVAGSIDWGRRHDHMQQHAGQHILSAAFDRLLDAGTVSFHLGAIECTIDIDYTALDPTQADKVEEYANSVVMRNLPIRSHQYTKQELESVLLRKPPKVEGLVRVVSVGDVDDSACGGTHPASAGEVGLIHIDRWERRRGAVRVTFMCLRAVRDYRRISRISRQVAARSSVSVDELPEAIDRLSQALDESRRQASALRAQWLELQATTLPSQAVTAGLYRAIARVLEGVDAGDLRMLAQRVCLAPDTVAILAVREPSPQFCLARSQDVPVNMNALLRAAAAPYGGRGGGPPNLVQGGGLAAEDLESMLARAVRYLADEQQTVKEGDRL
jgi:alanyl-tRNA synthetase